MTVPVYVPWVPTSNCTYRENICGTCRLNSQRTCTLPGSTTQYVLDDCGICNGGVTTGCSYKQVSTPGNAS